MSKLSLQGPMEGSSAANKMLALEAPCSSNPDASDRHGGKVVCVGQTSRVELPGGQLCGVETALWRGPWEWHACGATGPWARRLPACGAAVQWGQRLLACQAGGQRACGACVGWLPKREWAKRFGQCFTESGTVFLASPWSRPCWKGNEEESVRDELEETSCLLKL